ncbi:MAG: pirin family protein [Firmicutes bacterium]|nr:pirin family protein [Bacillota bacterium]
MAKERCDLVSLRSIRRLVPGRPAVDGAGVKLVRVFARDDTKDFDPFLMLDAFDSTNPEDYVKGFPWHPHRGIETITYLIKGEIEHGDSLGNRGTIYDGDCQWMTAGSGIIHQEMPQPREAILGCQLWLNLPRDQKMTEPAYGDIKSADVPIVREDGVSVRVIAGRYKETPGAFQGRYVAATYLDVELEPEQEWTLQTDAEHTLFVYIFTGQAHFHPDGGGWVDDRQAVLFDRGESFWVKAGQTGTRFVLLSARPLQEPIAWGGPIVMNTREELQLAFEELRNDTFIK